MKRNEYNKFRVFHLIEILSERMSWRASRDAINHLGERLCCSKEAKRRCKKAPTKSTMQYLRIRNILARIYYETQKIKMNAIRRWEKRRRRSRSVAPLAFVLISNQLCARSSHLGLRSFSVAHSATVYKLLHFIKYNKTFFFQFFFHFCDCE